MTDSPTDPAALPSGISSPAGPADLANPPNAPDPANLANPPAPEPLSGNFWLLWLGQFVSSFGSGLTSFGLGVWVVKQTGSEMSFAMMVLCSTLPTLIVTPWVGSVADRLDKRRVLMGSDVLALCGIGMLAWLLFHDRLQMAHLYAVQVLLALGLAFQAPAGQAAITRIVPKSQFGRAGGLFALSQAVSALFGPLLAVQLINAFGLGQVLLIDLATFVFSFVCLALARFPLIERAQGWSFWRAPLHDMGFAVNFYRRHAGMAQIYAYLALGGFLAGMVTVLVTPLVLHIKNAQVLAWITASAGLGVLLGSLGMAISGGPKQWHSRFLALSLIEGAAVALAGLLDSSFGLCLCAFFVMLSNSLLQAVVMSVWRRKVPMAQQGAVLAFQRAIELSLIPLAAIMGGALAQYYFEPAMLQGGRWAELLGPWFGIGKGRGTGVLFFAVGALVCLMSLVAFFSRSMRNLETDTPDAF
jgi:MFS family permease